MIIILPLLNIVYLLLNLFSSEIQSLCNSDGCLATVSLISITQSQMYILGIVALIVLICLYKYKSLYITFLHILIVCETVFLSYLYFKTGSICVSCFIFYGLLIVNYVVIAMENKPKLIVAMSILDINKEVEISNGNTLITSQSCTYCKEVKEELKTEYKEVDFKNVKELFKTLGLTTVPVYIIKEGNNIQIIEGKNSILKEVGTTDFIFVNPLDTQDLGCSIQKKEEDCD